MQTENRTTRLCVVNGERNGCDGPRNTTDLADSRVATRGRLEGPGLQKYSVRMCQQTFDLPGCAPWVFANAGGRGYYLARNNAGGQTRLEK